MQVAITGRYHYPNDSLKTVHAAQDEIRFRVGVIPEQDSQEDVLVDATLSRSLTSAHVADV